MTGWAHMQIQIDGGMLLPMVSEGGMTRDAARGEVQRQLDAMAAVLPEAVRIATMWREDRAKDDTVRVGPFMWTLLHAERGHAVEAATEWLDDFASIMEQAGVSVIIEWR